jgi:hypothetical protein
MELVPSNFVLVACLLSLLVMVRVRRHRRGSARASSAEQLDTVLAWPPTIVAPLNPDEREAYRLLRSALPNDLILSHIPLARFIRVPARRSEGVWLKKAGRLRVDLLLCDAEGLATAAVAVRAAREPSRATDRRERVQRVLQAAGITLHVWTAGRFPDLEEVRGRFSQPAASRRAVSPLPESAFDVTDAAALPEVTELGGLAP